MHGEYKVPGGKLVVVDAEVRDNRFVQVRLSGDFFLEPDDALELINNALTGLAADTDAATIAETVRRSLPEGALLFGFSAEAVATALRRAVQNASSWREHSWELVRPGQLPPSTNLALDQVLLESVAARKRGATLRIWEWNESAVVIGSFQSVRNEVDMEQAKNLDIPVLRRISGGGAMFMEAGAVITYSLYAPISLVQGMTFADSYAYLDDWVIIALRSLGVQASYQPLNDITSPLGKIGGAAQKRLAAGAILHHVTMAYDLDSEKMIRVLRIGREKLSDKGTTSAAKRVDPLKKQTGIPREKIIDRMIETFSINYGLCEGNITDDERERANLLVAEKFNTEEWLYRVP